MLFLPLITLLASCVAAAPTLYLVGDSTMATTGAGAAIQGWGSQVPQFFTGLTIVNKAIGGRSARSYTRENRWRDVQNLLKAGDFVVIEFGHNDGGSPTTSDRAAVGGEGDETQTVTLADGTREVVHTWPYYIKAMIDGAKSKGATPIISSTTPNEPYEFSDTINFTPGRFVTYAQNAAAAKGVPYVDHFKACMLLYQKLGKATTQSYFPQDHTHTNTAGAKAVAQAFLSGIKCPSAKGALVQYQNDAGRSAGARC